MSATFHGISIAGSGMVAYQTWLDALADNIANLNTITAVGAVPFEERLVEVRARNVNTDGVAGVDVVETPTADTGGMIVRDPRHPLANAEGLVVAPNMAIESLMTDLIIAQRSYQANTNVLNRARESYESTLRIGQ